METFFALLAICAGNSPVTGEFPAQRPETWSFGAFFDLRLNKRLSKQSWGWWFKTPSRPLWRHCNVSLSSCDRLVTWWIAWNVRHIAGTSRAACSLYWTWTWFVAQFKLHVILLDQTESINQGRWWTSQFAQCIGIWTKVNSIKTNSWYRTNCCQFLYLAYLERWASAISAKSQFP